MSTPALHLHDYHYRYPDGTVALAETNLDIAAGEKVALIGPNGAGKSTLLLAMAGFVKGSGTLEIHGQPWQRRSRRALRRRLGCCLEDPDDQLFMPRLEDDVAFGPLNEGLASDVIEARVAGALSQVGLTGLENKAPHHLSAGQKRRATLATVLAMHPDTLLLDEPEASLDPRGRRGLETLLKALPQTLVFATCHMAFAYTVAQRAVLIDNGRIITEGSTEKVMTDSDLMERHGLECP